MEGNTKVLIQTSGLASSFLYPPLIPLCQISDASTVCDTKLIHCKPQLQNVQQYQHNTWQHLG